MNNALGIDIGGTKISYAIIDNNGIIKSDVKKVSKDFMDGYFQVPKVLGEGA